LQYFIGLQLEPSLRDGVIAFRKKFPQLPPLRTEPHITLIPPQKVGGLNDIPLGNIESVVKQFNQFEVDVNGVGTLNQRVVYLKTISGGLIKFQAELSKLLEFYEDRPFYPHISLLNLRNIRSLDMLNLVKLEAEKFFKNQKFSAESIRIYTRQEGQGYETFKDLRFHLS
jgi:2'-5' RNA ligase